MYLKLRRQNHRVFAILLSFLLMGCSEIMLIGAYDQTVDESIQKISTDVSTLLVQLEKNIVDNRQSENKYDNFRNTYIDIEGQIATLRIRTGALPKYEKVKQQVELVGKNLDNLELLHKSGFTVPGKNPTEVIETVKTLFETSFTAMLSLQNGLKREKVQKN